MKGAIGARRNFLTFLVRGCWQDREIGRNMGFIVSCGIERWGRRVGALAGVQRKHPVGVSRWVSEAGRITTEDRTFADKIEALDQSMARKAIEMLAKFRAVEQES